MNVATQRPLLALAMLLAASVILVGFIAFQHRLSWLATAGTFYGILALSQIGYLALVVASGRNGASDAPLAAASRLPLL